MANILIVESKNDKAFFEALIEKMQINELIVDSPINIDNYECLSGLNSDKLTKAIKSLSDSLFKRNISKIGIIIDQDYDSQEEKLKLVNDCLSTVFGDISIIQEVGNLYSLSVQDIDLEIGTYFTNVNNSGELETLLKAIKKSDSTYADCLSSWQNCLKECMGEEGKLSLKEFDKFWLSIYLRYDTRSKKDSKQAGRKCSVSELEYILKHKDIFDFEHTLLEDIKNFLKLFT
ncbi:hypothetical protein AWQ21_07760 [Picosynechococcus sp. PCC 7003]|uniref:DUF3226 domain-containing protein n=1 Tax=Picosynechococcus sp. PCC 7003 TaxID=374981 RepID=UPI0008108C8D|nr:DUF3226 domain-containing protein [Picosynechococcus sp. PCC 7003]ANV84287.1 hypothetical protein AWQ21_07760 [Picosynechococcus sp. PCC 7003]